MKILFIASHLPHARSRAGLQIVYQRMKRLVERGHRVGLCALQGKSEGIGQDPLYEELVEVRRIPAPSRRSLPGRVRDYVWSRIPPPYWPFHTTALYRAVGDMVQAEKYDVALAEFTPMGQCLFENPWLPAVRKVISAHDCASVARRSPLFLPERSFQRAVREHLIRRDIRRFEFDLHRTVDRVLTLNRSDAFLLQAYEPSVRVSVVPPGIDYAYYQAAQTVSQPEPSLLFTGQYRDESNQDGFAWFVQHVWSVLSGRRPELTFHAVGPNPSLAMKLFSQQYRGVHVPGELADIRPLMQRASLFVCPIRMGSGVRVKILEAMAAGLPVVCTSTAAEGIPIQTGVNAVIADDPARMAEAIELLLDDAALRARIADNARRMVQERFDWDRSIDLLEATLADLLPGAMRDP